VKELLPEKRPILALAPMQDVTDLPFMRVMENFGGPDYYVTEYFRVYENSPLSAYILRSIIENESGKPIFAQMIGQDVDALVLNAKRLMEYPVSGIDLNLGCPAPTVCRKDAGGGLLRHADKLKRILGGLRESVNGRFTVKTRVGYESDDEFDSLLEIFKDFDIDALAIHGRTVKERYQTPVHTDRVKQAVNLMIGRGAIRSPWIFDQIRATFLSETIKHPRRCDLLEYVELLFDSVASEWGEYDERKHVNKMKKYMVYIAQGLNEQFEYQIRRAQSADEFHSICQGFLSSDDTLPDLPPESSKLFCGFTGLLE